MTNKELIVLLQQLPPDAKVMHLWDGAARTEINHVWLSRSGDVITADNNMVCYNTSERPEDAPSVEQVRYWYTPGEIEE